ncbi:hypothetical protein RQP46_010288 [Phenoliferia psychrophenolica]
MSFADLHLESPRQGLRSSSTSLLSTAALEHHHQFHANQDHAHSWDDYHSHGATALEDHLGDFMAESRFKEQFGSTDASPEFKGLGLDMDLDMRSYDGHDDDDDVHDHPGAQHPRDAGDAGRRTRTRLQSRSSKSQPYPTSSPSSPGRSRASSFRVTLPTHHTPLSSQDSSPFFPGGLPSPFRMPSTPTPSTATMDPAHSVRSSSPSSTSSIPPSRVGSSSAASSVYGGEGSSLLAASQTTSSSMSSAPSSHSHSHSHQDNAASSSRHRHKKSASTSTAGASSPKKPRGGAGRKLTDQDRRNICRHREANPSVKQDIIAERFNIERSTVSKILKNKDHWLALGDYDDEVFPLPSPALLGSPSKRATATPPEPEQLTPSTPGGASRIARGRYPEVDRLLEDWARSEAKAGTFLTDEHLQAQALLIAGSLDGCQTFRGSGTWIEGFKARAGITAGTFLDLHSPNSASRIQAQVDADAAADEAQQDEEDAEVADPAEDDHDDDFEDSKASRSRKSKRQAASRRHQSTPSAPADLGMARTTSPSLRMDVDIKTPMHPGFETALQQDQDATPTHHSRLHSHTRHSSKPHPVLGPLVPSASAYLPSLEVGDSGAALYSTYSPYSQAQAPFAQDQYAQHQQSPFQSSGVAVPFSPYASATEPGSGANSPAQYRHHGRSGSTASTASTFSTFSGFSSSQGGPPLTRSLYGSYPTTQTTPGSLPSTPHTGYFSHGADGNQSQLQAAFLVNGQHAQPLSPTGMQQHPGHPARRATISGGNPFHPAPVPMTRSLQSSATGSQRPQQSSRPTTSFDQAFASLQNVLEYLSQEGQGYITPGDLIALSDIKGKMMSHVPASAGFATYQAAPQRVKLAHTHSTGSINTNNNSMGMGTRRSHSSVSLLSTLDSASRILEDGM